MIVGTPIALGDGSYQFQQDDGEPLVLRGEAAQRAHAEAQGAPPSALPPSIDPSIVEAAKPPPDRRLAENEPTDEFSMIREQGMRPPPSLPDTRGSFAKGMDKVVFGVPETPKDVPRDIGDIDADQPQPKAARGSGPGKGVFYTPPAAQDPNAGLRYVKGGLTPHTRTEQGSLPMSDANEAATKMADQGRYEAAEGTANVAIQRAAEEARVRGEMATASMAEEARQQAAETERRQAVEKRLARIDKMGQDAANEKIDPEHYWVDKDAAFKFETALFAGLSAYAASRSGGKAYAVESMNDAIERDAKAQTANLDNKRKSIAQETNFLGELRNEYKDRDQALAAFRLAKQGTFLAKLDEIIASNVPAEQKAKLEETRAAIVAQRQEQRNALGKVDYAAQSVNVPGGYVKPGGGNEVQAENEQVMSIGNEHYAFSNKNEAEEAKQWVPRLERGSGELNRVAKLMNDPRSQIFGTEQYHDLKITLNNVAQEIPALNTGSNKLSETSVKHDQSVIGSPEDFIKLGTAGKQAAIRRLADEFDHVKRGHMQGAQLAKPYAVPGAKGSMAKLGFVLDTSRENPYAKAMPKVTPAGEEGTP